MRLLFIITLLFITTSCIETRFTPHTSFFGTEKKYPPYEGEVKILKRSQALFRRYDKVGMIETDYMYDFVINEDLVGHFQSIAAENGANAIILTNIEPLGFGAEFKKSFIKGLENKPPEVKTAKAIAIRLKE